MGKTVSRKLEETFRGALAGLPGLGGAAVRASHEDLSKTLPLAVVSARSSGRDEAVRSGGVVAEVCELRVVCAAHAGDAGSDAAVEQMAEAARAGVETANVSAADWRLLVLEFEGAERDFEGQVRTVTLSWRATALPQGSGDPAQSLDGGSPDTAFP
jgi:hypothetical protein